jgi:hypothetical protein
MAGRALIAGLAGLALALAGGAWSSTRAPGAAPEADPLLELVLTGDSQAKRVVEIPGSADGQGRDVHRMNVNWRLVFRFRAGARSWSWRPAKDSSLIGAATFDAPGSDLDCAGPVELPPGPVAGEVLVWSPRKITLEIQNPSAWGRACSSLGAFVPWVPYRTPEYKRLLRSRWLRFSFDPNELPATKSYAMRWDLSDWDASVVEGFWNFRAKIEVKVAE